MEPSAVFAMYLTAFSSMETCSFSVSSFILPDMVSMVIRLKSYRWHLDIMVIGILWTSVVASMKIT